MKKRIALLIAVILAFLAGRAVQAADFLAPEPPTPQTLRAQHKDMARSTRAELAARSLEERNKLEEQRRAGIVEMQAQEAERQAEAWAEKKHLESLKPHSAPICADVFRAAFMKGTAEDDAERNAFFEASRAEQAAEIRAAKARSRMSGASGGEDSSDDRNGGGDYADGSGTGGGNTGSNSNEDDDAGQSTAASSAQTGANGGSGGGSEDGIMLVKFGYPYTE